MPLSTMDKNERLLLLKFVCSFAWADLRIADQERKFVHKLVRKLKLDDAESRQVQAWLELPPRADEVDPNEIPREHRRVFLELAQEIVGADGDVSDEERESLELLQTLLA
jgi:uncharacterized tellurite resistance protein B-like protein